jgi:hypothetical protein
MANYPQLDNARGVWNLREVYDAVVGGYWPSVKNRLFFMGGLTSASPYTGVSTISTFNPTSGGTAELFGDLVNSSNKGNAGAGNFVRGLSMGGADWPGQTEVNNIQYITYATTGNAADFGDTTNTVQNCGGGSNSTRAIKNGGYGHGPNDGYQNVIDYVTIMSTGNATDFGDQTAATDESPGFSSPTRYIMGGGRSPTRLNTIDFVEISTTGNAVDFGDLTAAQSLGGTASNSTRGIFMGGSTPSAVTTVQFVTIPSQGNAIDFGDLANAVTAVSLGNAGVGNRGFVTGVNPGSLVLQGVEGISILNGGTATDFGDLVIGQRFGAVCSDAHGGLNDGYQGTRPAVFNEAGGDIAVLMGLNNGSYISRMETYSISTTGNSSKFGDLTSAKGAAGNLGSKTRGLMMGGGSPAGTSPIDYIEFKTEGNAADFGDLTQNTFVNGAMANNTRGFSYAGATPSATNVVSYVTISNLGDATDFGDASNSTNNASGLSSNTRAIGTGGDGPINTNIDYFTISTVGNYTDFGDLTVARTKFAGGINSSTRGCFAGGDTPSLSNVIDYITIATTGNATDFGDTQSSRSYIMGGSNSTRGVLNGGLNPSRVNTVGFITISSTGNASDFGDLIDAAYSGSSAACNGHGGLVGG